MLVKILNENEELSYLAVACLSLLIEAEKEKLQTKLFQLSIY